MKDHIKGKLSLAVDYSEADAIVDGYMNYYNNQCYQWQLARLSPNEYYKFVTTGDYPLDILNMPAPRQPKKSVTTGGKRRQIWHLKN